MDIATQTNKEQMALWNGVAGRAWVEAQALLDQTFEPLEDLLVGTLAGKGASRVLDVGCGAGSTTLAVARMVGVRGHCVGIDISEPLIAAARVRAEREGATADFIRADAQIHAFKPASFDRIISRFGVMFFEDSVKAFANLRLAASDDAELQFLAWRSAADNPFMTIAERAAKPLLPNVPERNPDAPGQFAFADQDRVRRILVESGWADVDIRAVDVPCRFPAKDLVRYFTELGPLGRALHDADELARTRIVATALAAFYPYVHGDEVHFDAACWMVGARSLPRYSR